MVWFKLQKRKITTCKQLLFLRLSPRNKNLVTTTQTRCRISDLKKKQSHKLKYVEDIWDVRNPIERCLMVDQIFTTA